jgi:hypothetical protein
MWPHPDLDWPFWSPRLESRAAFVTAFRWLGYRKCGHSRPEFWFDKVALYELNDIPKHMARQLRDGTWTSKCGGWEDITHFTLDALDSAGPLPWKAEYGSAVLFMKRFVAISWIVRLSQWLGWQMECLFPRIGYWVWRRRQ